MRGTFLESEIKVGENYDINFVGVKCCSADYLIGVEKAADEIRKLSYRYANADGSSHPLKIYNPDEGYILPRTVIRDVGDITANDLHELGEKVEKLSIDENAIPFFVGGDHAVSYHIVKKIAKMHDDFIVVQFDAHSDFIDEYADYPHGSVMKEVSKLNHVTKIIHLGLRGNLNSQPAIDDSLNHGNLAVPYSKINAMMAGVIEVIKGKKVYITFDTDFLNPSVAPATNSPEPGGPSYEETLQYMKLIAQNAGSIIGVDFVEYNPTCDGAMVTGITLVNLMMECMHYFEIKRKGDD